MIAFYGQNFNVHFVPGYTFQNLKKIRMTNQREKKEQKITEMQSVTGFHPPPPKKKKYPVYLIQGGGGHWTLNCTGTQSFINP